MYSRAPFIFPLFFHIERHTGLELHGEFILVDGDLFKQPPDKSLVVFRQGSGLFSQESVHVGMRFFCSSRPALSS